MAGKKQGKRGSFRSLMLEAQRKQKEGGDKKLTRKEKKQLKTEDLQKPNNEIN